MSYGDDEKFVKLKSPLSGKTYWGDSLSFNIKEDGIGQVFLGKEDEKDELLVTYDDVTDEDELQELVESDYDVTWMNKSKKDLKKMV